MTFDPPLTTMPAQTRIVMTLYPVAPTESVTVIVSVQNPTGVVESTVTTPVAGLSEIPVNVGAIVITHDREPPE